MYRLAGRGSLIIRMLAVAAALTIAAGCDDGSGSAGDTDGDTGEPTPYPFEELEAAGLLDYLDTVEASSMSQSGGVRQYDFDVADGPICLRGASFTVATRPSDASNDLLIYLQGGGACWEDLCAASPEAAPGIPTQGALSPTLAANPFKDWDVGYVPYCDGSLFAGDIDVDEDGDDQPDRYHRGLLNLSAAYGVIAADYPDPDRIVLVGASAGSYGTIFGAALLRAVYPDTRIDVVADAGLALGKPDDEAFILGVLDDWNMTRLVPASCEACTANGHLTRFITWVLDRDPNMRYAGISAVQDVVIGTLFLGLGGPGYEEVVREQTAILEGDNGPAYRRFLFEGSDHTVVGTDSTYEGPSPSTPAGVFDVTNVDGTTPAAWLGEWLGGDVESLIWE